MAKKKEETTTEQVTNKDLAAIQTKLEEHQQTIENFRTSFQNLETKIKNLIERNRLR